MSEIVNLLYYVLGGIAALILIGFFLYYAGRLIGLGVMRSIHDVQNNRLDRRTG